MLVHVGACYAKALFQGNVSFWMETFQEQVPPISELWNLISLSGLGLWAHMLSSLFSAVRSLGIRTTFCVSPFLCLVEHDLLKALHEDMIHVFKVVGVAILCRTQVNSRIHFVLLIIIFFTYLCIWVFCVQECLGTAYMPGAYWSQKRASDLFWSGSIEQ